MNKASGADGIPVERREGGSRCGAHVNPWLIHVNVWQKKKKKNYNIVK